MNDRQKGVPEKHPRAREAHDGSDPVAHDFRVAVDPAIRTNRLRVPKRAFREPESGVLIQFFAVAAQRTSGGRVPRAAINANHRRDRFLFE
jgi:hypothetical protein